MKDKDLLLSSIDVLSKKQLRKEYQLSILEIYKLEDKINRAIEKIKNIRIFGLRSGKTLIATLLNEALDILEGEDDE